MVTMFSGPHTTYFYSCGLHLKFVVNDNQQRSIVAHCSSAVSASCAQPLPQRDCSVRGLAYGAVFKCVSNKTDASLNTCCGQYEHYRIVPYAEWFCGLAKFCHSWPPVRVH